MNLPNVLLKNKTKFRAVVSKSLLKKPHRLVNLAEEVLNFLKRHPRMKLNFKDLVNPFKYRGLEDKLHQDLGVEWSYGSYLENRSVIFQHTYLKETQCWIHLGIDINIPVGAEVLATLDGSVHMISSDYPEKGGWGNFVILEHKLGKTKFYSIYGHLGREIPLTVTQYVRAGETVGWVGKIEENGFWRPHTHVQFISEKEIARCDYPFSLDGYGHPKDLDYLRENYPDPLSVIPMK